MTFAVIKTGGKQYIVKEGDILLIEKIPDKAGEKFNFDQILLCADEKTTQIGTPLVAGAKVEAEIIDQIKGKKVNVIKYKRKTRYHRKRGHRQLYTKIKITKITA